MRLNQSDQKLAAVQALMLQLDQPEFIDDAGDTLSWFAMANKGFRDEKRDSITENIEIFSPSGGATLYRREFLEEMEGFDDDYFAYLEDVDLGLRGKMAGYTYQLIKDALVYHKSHGSDIPKKKYVELLTRNRLFLFIEIFHYRF